MWYMITPWKTKCIGKTLPKKIEKIGRKLPMRVYMLNYAVVIYRKPKEIL